MNKNDIYNVFYLCRNLSVALLEAEAAHVKGSPPDSLLASSEVLALREEVSQLETQLQSEKEKAAILQCQIAGSNEIKAKETSGDSCVACALCQKLFTEQKYLEKHIKLKHSKMKERKRSHPLDVNIETASRGRIHCSICAEEYDNMTDYTHHLNLHLQGSQQPQNNITTCSGKVGPCDSTDSSLKPTGKSSCTTTNHSSRLNIWKLFCCTLCFKSYKLKSDLIDHMYSKHGITFKGGENISAAFTAKGKQQSFVDSNAKAKSPKLIKFCVFGGIRKEKKVLEVHKCNVCDKLFYYKTMLKKHVQQHVRNAPFNVIQPIPTNTTALRPNTQSARAAQSPSQLSQPGVEQESFQTVVKQEDNNEIKAYPYKCHHCLKAFDEKYKLAQHNLVHDIIAGKKRDNVYREFNCPGCAQPFVYIGHMNRHAKKCPAAIEGGYHTEIEGTVKRKRYKRKGSSQKLSSHMKGICCDKKPQGRCLMCLHWFNGEILEKHLCICEAKRACLNRIEMEKSMAQNSTQLKLEFDDLV